MVAFSFEAPAAPWFALNPIPPAAALGAVVQLEHVSAAPLPPVLPGQPLRWEPDAALAVTPFEASADPWPAVRLFP